MNAAPPPGPLLGRFLEVCARRGAHFAVVDDHLLGPASAPAAPSPEAVTFAELERRARAVAAALRARGLGGQRVALLVTQGSAWLEAFFGGLLAGAVVVPLSHLHPELEQRWFVETSGAAAVLVSPDLAERAAAFAGARPLLDVVALRDPTMPSGPTSTVRPMRAGPGPREEGVRGEPSPRSRAGAREHADLALILYTSGTTGKPKGALISQENLASVARLLQRAWRWSEDDVLVHALPLHHLHGLGISLLTSVLAGSTTRMLARFDAARTWDALEGATVLMGVPTMHRKLLDALDAAPAEVAARWRAHAARLRLVTSGSAALPATVGERWRALTGQYPLERFGMTEIGVGLSNPVEGPRVPGSCGPPLPGMEIRVVADDGADAPPGAPGEIWIRGPSVFLGYDGNPEATAAAFVEGGWFRSGDTATFLPDGGVRILGRTSVDILKSGGYKLSALEIEEVLREHPAVADVAVVGLPDEVWGEVAVAALIPRPGRAGELTEEAVRAFAKGHLAPYKVPRRVALLDDFPRNPVGKVQKPALIEALSRRAPTPTG